MKPFLSILIPTRNRAAYLKYAIQSAINIRAEDIEIIVSENHSSDSSLEVCNSFSDPRLKVIRPSSPVPMHENWEFLLKEARGEWVTFVGDDDAVMPHCVDHLRYLCKKYPQAEAILSPKAYYFWDGCQEVYGDSTVNISIKAGEKWRDSKKELKRCLNGVNDYRNLPEMYSGGFQRRTLINRVFRAQNGLYFRSVTPDAYSALMSVIFTYQFLETGVPMVWVGTSPHRNLESDQFSHKDRKADFWGMHSEDSLTINRSLGDLEQFTFPLVFFEAYISAFPLTSYSELSLEKVRSLFLDAVKEFRRHGNEAAVEKLASNLGFSIPSSRDLGSTVTRLCDYFFRRVGRIFRLAKGYALAKIGREAFAPIYSYRSTSQQTHPDILSCDSLISEGYEQWLKKNRIQQTKGSRAEI
ncbi:MAG: hypothetical protein AMJ53_04960 [Gammaproteobacteria bacterium SG8_11]|nr:MAG: hypothetical protein AMJ53_04960 [Gammaproteobacteria bacterium SG8_11]